MSVFGLSIFTYFQVELKKVFAIHEVLGTTSKSILESG